MVLRRPEQLPNDLEHHLDSGPGKLLVFARFATSAHHVVCSHQTRIRSLLGVALVEGRE